MKIAIVTGSRAEYGIMNNLIKTLVSNDKFDTKVFVTGMHLEEKYGNTYKYILDDGVKIHKKIHSEMKSDDDEGIINSYSTTMLGFKDAFINERPDFVLVLGDRYEIFSVCTTAALLRIPIVHLHGGEVTSGNYDEFIRHSITKMASLHLTASEEFANRIKQLGEESRRIFTVGSLGVENIKNIKIKKIEDLNTKLGFKLDEGKYFLVAFHPETLSNDVSQNKELLEALKIYADKKQIIFLGVNSDTNSSLITKNLNEFMEQYPKNTYFINSLPVEFFYALVSYCELFIGNSSAGLIEVPTLKKVTINIGDRQQGRLQGNSVFNVRNKKEDILAGIKESKKFDLNTIENPYEKDNTSNEIIRILEENIKVIKDIKKIFQDIN